jgi:hypothetical protein
VLLSGNGAHKADRCRDCGEEPFHSDLLWPTN